MTLTIISEIVSVIVMLFAGHSLWILIKRDRLFKSIMSDESSLESMISLGQLDSFVSTDSEYLKKNGSGYSINIISLLRGDRASTRYLKLAFVVLIIIVLIVSYYMSNLLLLLNTVVFMLLYLSPLRAAAYRNVRDQVRILAAILYKWRNEDEKVCDDWIELASNLKAVYAVVQKNATGQKTAGPEEPHRAQQSRTKKVSESMLSWRADEALIKEAERGNLLTAKQLLAGGVSINAINEALILVPCNIAFFV